MTLAIAILVILGIFISWEMAECLINELRYGGDGSSTMLLVTLWGVNAFALGLLIGAGKIMEVYN